MDGELKKRLSSMGIKQAKEQAALLHWQLSQESHELERAQRYESRAKIYLEQVRKYNAPVSIRISNKRKRKRKTMPYLNLDVDYFSHRKIVRLQAILGKGAAELPIRIWSYCAKFHPEDGRLVGYSEEEIERIAEWHGEPGKMIATMIRPEICLLEKIDGGWVIHNWLEHARHLSIFKKRAKTAAKKRWKKYASSMLVASKNDATTGLARLGKVSINLKEGEESENGEKTVSAFRQFTDYFCSKFENKFSQKYQFQKAKDAEIVKRLLAIRRLDQLIELIDRFFDSTDSFILQSGYTLGVFESQINRLIVAQVVRPMTPAERTRQFTQEILNSGGVKK
jgi:hypothetical protein